LQGRAARAFRLIGAPLSPAEKAKLDRILEAARQSFGEDAIALALAEGRAMSLDRATTYALEDGNDSRM